MQLNWQRTKNKKFEAVVVFVHHFGGNAKTTKRHQKMLNQLGFDCVSFSLPGQFDQLTLKNYLHVNYLGLTSKNGLVGLWQKHIEKVVEQIQRPIVLYTLSSPSLAVMGLIPKNNHIKAWICDGGPFLNLRQAFDRYYKEMHNIHNPLVLKFFAQVAYVVWRQSTLTNTTHGHLKAFPKNFPVLSLRSQHDRLVFEQDIDEVFPPECTPFELQKNTFQNSGHLNAITKESAEYKEIVSEFLKSLEPNLLPVKQQ